MTWDEKTMILHQSQCTIHPPFKKLRLFITFLCLLFSAPLVYFCYRFSGVDIVAIASCSLMLLIGLWAGFFERVIIIDQTGRYGSIEYRLLGKRVWQPARSSLAGVDRIKILEQRYQIVNSAEAVMIADTLFPVQCLQRDQIVFEPLGDNGSRRQDGRVVVCMTPFFNASWFEEHARLVAATLAIALNVSLEYPSLENTFSPNEIPGEWLDPKNVRFKLKWRRRNKGLWPSAD